MKYIRPLNESMGMENKIPSISLEVVSDMLYLSDKKIYMVYFNQLGNDIEEMSEEKAVERIVSSTPSIVIINESNKKIPESISDGINLISLKGEGASDFYTSLCDSCEVYKLK